MKFATFRAAAAVVVASTSLAAAEHPAQSPPAPHHPFGILRHPRPEGISRSSKRSELPELPYPLSPEPVPLLRSPVDSESLRNTITTEALRKHAENLQAIADQTNRKNRAFGTIGHNYTNQYIYEALEALSEYYTVSYQPLKLTAVDLNADFIVNDVEILTEYITFSPQGTVTAELAAVPSLGCAASNYAGVSGKIAVIERGTCEFGLKVALAGAAGAVGAIIFNNAATPIGVPSLGTTSRPEGPYVLAGAISQAAGKDLVSQIQAGPVTASFTISTVDERYTANIIAQTKGGDQNNVIFLGAHSDSVAVGPGINDNGSGLIALLEVALQLTKYDTTNAVRFAWWTAEEYFLRGSKYYVENGTTPSADLDAIRLYLNFDMIASPNYRYGIFDGDGSTFNLTAPAGSAEAEKLFGEYFTSQGLKSQPIQLTGRTDYAPFLEAGFAVGGLSTGAEGIKTEEEASWYGGQAGVEYDPNYHLPGDTIDNLNFDAFLANAKAIAHAVATYGTSFDSLPPRSERKKRSVFARGEDAGEDAHAWHRHDKHAAEVTV